jgi:hypothetical protein
MANDITTTGRFDLVAADKTLAAAKPEDMQDLHRACSDLQNARLDNLPARIEHAEAVLRRVEPIATLARKTMEPASDRMLQAHLAALVGAFPNAPKADIELYGRALAMDVADAKPSGLALVRTCRRLRRTCRFVPTISEVLEVLEEEELRAKVQTAGLRYLPKVIEDARERARTWPELISECAALIEDMDRGNLHRTYRPSELPNALDDYPTEVIKNARAIVNHRRAAEEGTEDATK